MNKIKTTILGSGTSQGVPVIGCRCDVCTSQNPKDNRTRVSAYVEIGDSKILIDAGPDLRNQLLREKISDVDAVLLTHEHNDHIAGLDDLRPINFLYQKTIPIYAEERVCKRMEISFAYIFDNSYQYPGKPRLELTAINEQPFYVKREEIVPIRVLHGELPILGYRIGRFCYLTDVKTITTSELEKLKDLDFLVINALHYSRHHSHLNMEECLALINRIGARRSYITHISHRMGRYTEVSETLPENVFLSFDGLVIQ